MNREVARLAPELGKQLRRWQKEAVDRVAADIGNYSTEFARLLEEGLSDPHGRSLPVRLIHWSSENHHLGRADGCIRLLDGLATDDIPLGQRVLLWGHSHGGNVLALLTNLLAADSKTRQQFFRAASSYYRWPLVGKVDLSSWSRVESLLEGSDRPWESVKFDIVTFGTPVRYGWDTDGCDGLLHFVNHRPGANCRPHHGRFPPTVDDLLHAAGGDVLQLIGIAGTNFTPPLWSWRAWLAELRLNRLLQTGIRKRDLLARLRMGHRTHADGRNLLVDYGEETKSVAHHVAGHAIYTRTEWMLFHAEETARHLYSLDKAGDNAGR